MQFSFWPEDILPRIRDLLLEVHGPQQDRLRLKPTAQFVGAMLSSRTYDAIARGAFERLWLAFRSWDVLPKLQPSALLLHIGNVTFAEPKARHLIQSSRIVQARRGTFDLAFLGDRSLDNAYAWLIGLPGVGPKVAAATLNFSLLNKRILVVDTHVLRISKRLQLVPQNANFARGFESLMRLVPEDWNGFDLYQFHWLMKLHGQTRCHANRPHCDGCPLTKLCPSYTLN